LGKIGKSAQAAVAPLEQMLLEADPIDQPFVAGALFRIDGRLGNTVDLLLKCVDQHGPAGVALNQPALFYAREVLLEMGPAAAPQIVPGLLPFLNPENRTSSQIPGLPPTRDYALRLLARLGPAGKEAVPELTALLKAGRTVISSETRILALLALEAIGPDAAESVPVLVNIVMARPESAAGQVGQAHAAQGMRAVSGPGDVDHGKERIAAANALGAIGPAAKAAREELASFLPMMPAAPNAMQADLADRGRLRQAVAAALLKIVGPADTVASPAL
jgi:hypothetical protein